MRGPLNLIWYGSRHPNLRGSNATHPSGGLKQGRQRRTAMPCGAAARLNHPMMEDV